MKKMIIVFVIAFGIISCNSDGEIKIDNSNLIGNWIWTGTSGGVANQINETPTTTGKTIELDLKADYSYSVLENGIEISKGFYKLTMKNSIYSVDNEPFISYSDNLQFSDNLHQYVVLGGRIIRVENILDISDNFYDGVGSTFKKMK